MRTASALLLTALVCINLFGFYTMFVIKQAEVKEETRDKLGASSSLTHYETLTFSNAEFAQLSFNDNGRELHLNGSLYDVVNVENTGNGVKITVEYDSKETQLIQAFGNLFKQQQNQDQTSSPLKTIFSHFQQDYVPLYAQPCSYNDLSFIGECVANNSYPTSSFVGGNLTPPPQFFLV
jgi:hypothetical protein